MAWYLIETLGQPPSASIVFKEGEPREWASVRRMSQKEGGLDRIEDLISAVRQSREPLDHIEVGRGGPRRVVMRPVLGYEGEVYGIKTWVSLPETEVTPERAIASVNWDVETLTARQRLESYMMSSVSPDGFGDTRDPGQFLRKVVQFDALNELAEVCLNDGTRTQFQGQLTVLHDDTHLMTWCGVARGEAGEDGSEVRGMFHDITDTTPPKISPLAALKIGVHDESTTGTVLIAYRDHHPNEPVIPVLMYWVSPRPHYIAESATDHQHSEIPGNLVNPDHFGEFLRAREMLKAGQDELEIPIVVELLGRDGQWVKVRFHLRRYPGTVGSMMHIGRFSRLIE